MAYRTLRDRSDCHSSHAKSGGPDRGPINCSDDPDGVHAGRSLIPTRDRTDGDLTSRFAGLQHR